MKYGFIRVLALMLGGSVAIAVFSIAVFPLSTLTQEEISLWGIASFFLGIFVFGTETEQGCIRNSKDSLLECFMSIRWVIAIIVSLLTAQLIKSILPDSPRVSFILMMVFGCYVAGVSYHLCCYIAMRGLEQGWIIGSWRRKHSR